MTRALTVAITQLPHAKKMSLPSYSTELSAGMDLEAAIEQPITLQPRERSTVPSGIAIAMPPGYEAQIRGRSGLSAKHGITTLNSPGTIDADYRGEIKIIVVNHGLEPFTIEPGMRIAQMVIARHERVEWQLADTLDETARGVGGLGSTGTAQKAAS